MKKIILAAALLAASNAFAQSNSAELKATYQDIQATMGRIPGFLKELPAAQLPGSWQESKEVLLNPRSAVPRKYMALIGLAVSSQLSCKNCVFFDSEAAKSNDANAEEIRETIGMAGLTRHWSTFLNGSQIDPVAFKREADEMMLHARKQRAGEVPQEGTPSRSEPRSELDRTYADIQKTLGRVPLFLRDFPKEGVTGAWKEMKELQLNPNTAIPPKYKELIGLAVAAQIPCSFCTYFHTEAAKVNGATPEEVREVLAVAALARQREAIFSTTTESDPLFRKDVVNMMRFVRDHRVKQQLGGQVPSQSTE